jgi:hypothetical protein
VTVRKPTTNLNGHNGSSAAAAPASSVTFNGSNGADHGALQLDGDDFLEDLDDYDDACCGRTRSFVRNNARLGKVASPILRAARFIGLIHFCVQANEHADRRRSG